MAALHHGPQHREDRGLEEGELRATAGGPGAPPPRRCARSYTNAKDSRLRTNGRVARVSKLSFSTASFGRQDGDIELDGVNMVQEPRIEVAALADAELLEDLIERSARALCVPDYTPEQIESALGSVWGLDTQLIEDQTYFVARAGASVVACGGWSWRETLFGADTYADRSPRELQPGRDAARIRAFFVCPQWVRRGLGRRILLRCEHEASRRGFSSAQLMATLPGVRLYRECGYTPLPQQSFLLPGGGSIDFVPMVKQLFVHTERTETT